LFEWGDRWKKVGGGLPEGFFYAIAIHPDKPGTWAASQMGRVFLTRDGGGIWQEAAGALEGALIREIEFFEGKILAIAEGRGVFTRDFLP
jgi:photosystem II stability/assembly factor-like uncharacterized protein